jgi:hypothetical protein
MLELLLLRRANVVVHYHGSTLRPGSAGFL